MRLPQADRYIWPMRALFLLSFFHLLARVSAAQQLQGIYETQLALRQVAFSYEQFRFKGSRFWYQYEGCTQSLRGYGSFHLTADSLTLRFEDSTVAVATRVHPVACTGPGYCCTVADARTGQPLADAQLQVRRSRPVAPTTVFTDAQGVAFFTASQRMAPTQADSCLVVSAPGYEPVTILLAAPAGRGFGVLLAPLATDLAAGIVYRYGVQLAGSDTFSLSSATALPGHYQRLTKERMRQLARAKKRTEKL